MPRLPHEEFAACVGLDWADAKHDVCCHAVGDHKRAFRILEPTPEALNEGAGTRRKRCAGPPGAGGLELHPGPLVYALRQSEVLVLFPGNPRPLAQDRDAVTPSHAKDAPTDAALPLALRLKPRDTLTPRKPASPALRARAPLVDQRRRRVGDHGRRTHRRTRALQHDFPQGRPWVDAHDPTIVCAVRTPWPPLNAVQLARRAPRERFFRAHHGRDADVMAQRSPAIPRATPRTTDEGIIAPPVLRVQALVSQLRVPWQAIDAFDEAMAHRAQRPPDCPVFDALPGAGAVLAPRLLAAFGAPRDRYTAADELPKYASSAPVTERRGHTAWGHWRLQGPTCLRQTVVAWAAESRRHSFGARAYYQPQRNKGSAHPAAVRARAFPWSRLLLRGGQHRTPDDASL